MEKYSTDVNVERLKVQFTMLPDLIKTANEQYQFAIKRATSISTLCDIMNACTFSKSIFSEVHWFLRIYLTIPMSSATAERTNFSTLRILKNYMRLTMTQKRLNHVMLLYIYKQKVDQLDLKEIAKSFIKVNNRQMAFISKFWRIHCVYPSEFAKECQLCCEGWMYSSEFAKECQLHCENIVILWPFDVVKNINFCPYLSILLSTYCYCHCSFSVCTVNVTGADLLMQWLFIL